MEQKKQIVFSEDKLAKTIKSINILCEKISQNKNSKPLEEDETNLKKNFTYIKKYFKKLSKEDLKEKICFLEIVMKISKNSLKICGDDLLESLWEMYDSKNFQIYNLDFTVSYYEYFLHLFFLNHKNLDILIKKQFITIDKEKRKIESHFDLENFGEIFLEEFKEGDLSNEKILEKEDRLTEKKNFMIDLFILQIFCYSKISLFYTSLSSFIVNTESNVMLLFKAISLFALCLWNLENKENFVGSLIFVVGGVLRDHGRSYLKTKGILNENLSYHQCKNHDDNHSHYFPPTILTSKECSYLELYFLSIMQQFLKTILSDINYDLSQVFLDDCIPLYFRYLEQGDNSDEYSHLPEIQIFQFVNLFLSDFLFFFITNFCKYEGNVHTSDIAKDKITHRHLFTTNFSNFDDFIDYSLTIVNKSYRNVTKMFEISEQRKRMQETECEKTEYQMKDGYNHYGVCLIFYLYLNGGYSHVNLLNEKDFVFETSFLPLILRKDFYLDIYLEALSFILHTESLSENRFMKDFKIFCFYFLKDVKRILFENEIKEGDRKFEIIERILSDFVNFEEKEKIKEVFEFVKDKEKLYYQSVMKENNNDKINNFFKLSEDVKISAISLGEIIKKLLTNKKGFSFDDKVLQVIKNKISSGDLKEKELFVENLKLIEKERTNGEGDNDSNLETLRKLIKELD